MSASASTLDTATATKDTEDKRPPLCRFYNFLKKNGCKFGAGCDFYHEGLCQNHVSRGKGGMCTNTTRLAYCGDCHTAYKEREQFRQQRQQRADTHQ